MSAFVSHDGPDNSGVRAEVFVQAGTGIVEKIEGDGSNVNVFMKVEGLKHPVKGWISRTDPIFPAIEQAHASGEMVTYRIESQRKIADRTIPIAELRKDTTTARENTKVLFTAINGAASSEAVTDPAEDPEGGRIPATRGRGGNQSQNAGPGLSADQALAGLAAARQGGLPPSVIDSCTALALAAGATVAQVSQAGVDPAEDSQQRPPMRQQRVAAAEAPPYQAFNTDGAVNPGSFAVQAASGAESMAADLLAANNAAIAEAHNAAVEAGKVEGGPVQPSPVDFGQAAGLGGVLLDLADRVQVNISGYPRPNRQANSHTRARSFVYDAVKNRYPVPFGKDAEAQKAWKQAVVGEASDRFARVMRMVSGEPAPAQQAPAREVARSAQPQGQAQGEPQAPSQAQAPVQGQAGEQVQGEPQAGEQAQAREQGPQRPPIQGEDGWIEPESQVVQRFSMLALNAGFMAGPESPVTAYVREKFGVTTVRMVHGPALERLVSWFESKGENSVEVFKAQVMQTAGTPVPA